MKAGMNAAMGGLGQATQAVSALPVVGALGGLGSRKRSPIVEALGPILGGLGGLGALTGGGKAKRQLYPKLDGLPDAGSAGLLNLGMNSKVKRQLDVLKSLPLLGGLMGGRVKRQIESLSALLPGLLGGKVKREAQLNGLPIEGLLKGLTGGKVKRQLDLVKTLPVDSVPVVGGIVGGLQPRAELGFDGVKKVIAVVADIRGVTSKREAVPEEGDFRSELRAANKAKVDGELSKAADEAERDVKIKNTKFPPGKVKSPKEALDKRAGLDTLPVKDIVESTSGLKSAMELVKTVGGAVENRNGK